MNKNSLMKQQETSLAKNGNNNEKVKQKIYAIKRMILNIDKNIICHQILL